MKPTAREREDMIQQAIDRLVAGQNDLLQARYSGSRAGLDSYAEDQAALKGIGLVTSRETRYAERWRPTATDARHTGTTIDGTDVLATVRAKFVKVIAADGSVTYRAASSFRKRTNTRNPRITHNATPMQHRITAADLAPIGNVE